MATMQRVIPQGELDAGFGLLRDIIDIIKDPKGLEAAHKAAREQARLTEEQQNKLVEARSVIAEGDELAAELRKEQDELHAAQETHDGNVKKFNDESLEKSKQLEIFSSQLDARAEELNRNEKERDDEKSAFEKYKSEEQKKLDDRATALGEEKAALDKITVAQGKEADRLEELRNTLNTRAKKVGLLEQAAEL